TAAASADLHGQPQEDGAARRQRLEVREILEDERVGLPEDAVRAGVPRLAAIDRGGVDADAADPSLPQQPAGCLVRQAGEVEMLDVAAGGPHGGARGGPPRRAHTAR